MELLFKKLVLDDTPTDLLELSADALLPLILADPPAYQQLGTQLLQTQGMAGGAGGEGGGSSGSSKMSEALGALLGSNGLQQSLSGVNKRRFRQNLCQMVLVVRGLLRTR